MSKLNYGFYLNLEFVEAKQKQWAKWFKRIQTFACISPYCIGRYKSIQSDIR